MTPSGMTVIQISVDGAGIQFKRVPKPNAELNRFNLGGALERFLYRRNQGVRL
jgi:hypothetical protein